MQLRYVLISPQELTHTEKVLLACREERFYFIRRKGILQINKELPEQKLLAQIAAAMWQFDCLLGQDGAEQMDALLQRVTKIVGKGAAVQLNKAWSEALHEKLEAEDRQAAAEWLENRNIPEELDAICDAMGTYCPGFIQALWKLSFSTDAIFLYGYQSGLEAAGRRALQ